MNRQNMPLKAAAPDMPAQINEIRMPSRSTGHETRNGKGVVA